MTIIEVMQIQRKRKGKEDLKGFEKGLHAKKIVGITKDAGKPRRLFFLMEWEGSDEMNLVPVEEANEREPNMVIRFYEGRLKWEEKEGGNYGSA